MRHSFAVIPSTVFETRVLGTRVLGTRNKTASRALRAYLRMAMAMALALLTVTTAMAQAPAKRPPAATQKKSAPRGASAAPKTTDTKAAGPDLNWLQDLLKNRELMAELETLTNKLRAGVQYPAPRSQSRILGLLPESTTLYAALPNYGESVHQALQIFHQELSQSAPLRDFLQKNQLDTMEPKLEQGVQRFYEITQYLGDELVIAGGLKGQEPAGVVIAEVKKPGLRDLLEKLNNEQFPDKSSRLRIFGPQQLASAVEQAGAHGPAVLVRDDLIVLGTTVASLREFNSQVEQGGAKFASAALGQKLAQAYQSGTGTLLAVDLQKIMGLMPPDKSQNRMLLEKSGFSDVQYLVTENKLVNGASANHAELTFTGPRRGIASWIAAPAPMGALDFVSSTAASVIDVRLKSPALIFDDLREIAGAAAFASLPQMEEQLNVNLKQDVLSKLTGEIALETKIPTAMFSDAASGVPESAMHATKTPSIKVILGVSDPAGLQQTLVRLLAVAPAQSGQREEAGVTIHTLAIPSSGEQNEINYFFLDGYLIIASDRAGATEALHAHRSGDSLAKSAKLRESLQAGGLPASASILTYQNASQFLMPLLAQLSPEMRQLMPSAQQMDAKPGVFSVVADERAFRGTMNSNVQTDIGMMLIGAAVAIPNLTHARGAANESAAAASVRTVNTAQVTYATVYPAKGYAPSLAMLGPPANGDCSDNNNGTSGHACLLDHKLGNAACSSGKWCEKNGYRFSVRGVCGQTANCKGYVVTATPVGAGTGKSFCSVSDAVLRSHTGAPLAEPLTAAECRAWTPIQ